MQQVNEIDTLIKLLAKIPGMILVLTSIMLKLTNVLELTFLINLVILKASNRPPLFRQWLQLKEA